MTDTQNTGTLSLVTLAQTLDVGDVLSVVTSRAETRLHADLEAAKRSLAEAEKTVKSLAEAATKKYAAECRAAADAVATKLRPSVESVGGKVVVCKKDHWQGQRRERNDDGLLTQHVSVVASQGGYNREATFVASATPSEALLALEASVEAAERDVADRQAEALRVRKRLANVPLLERKARARLAEAKLSESKDGQAVLDALTSEFEADFLALPSN